MGKSDKDLNIKKYKKKVPFDLQPGETGTYEIKVLDDLPSSINLAYSVNQHLLVVSLYLIIDDEIRDITLTYTDV